jgi:hypothetical protein
MFPYISSNMYEYYTQMTDLNPYPLRRSGRNECERRPPVVASAFWVYEITKENERKSISTRYSVKLHGATQICVQDHLMDENHVFSLRIPKSHLRLQYHFRPHVSITRTAWIRESTVLATPGCVKYGSFSSYPFNMQTSVF